MPQSIVTPAVEPPAVVAVTTTGIYCRPGGCSAQPLSQNTLQFPTSAAAEAAGYRACLKCRPYRSPVHVPWRGSELVCRAVRMILSGALDDRLESELAMRLGVSARHLRRLFINQLGVTPVGLARSARAHFARRLLDDTDLPVTHVAYAAGFGSLRQFNRVCQEVFRAVPSELRSRRRKADRLAADGGLAMRLHFHGPLDWNATLTYLAAHAIPGVEHVSDDGSYRRTVEIGGDPGVLELMRGGSGYLILRAHLPHWEDLIHVAERTRQIANLDLDPREAMDRLGSDGVIGPLLRSKPGLRPPGAWDPFETGVRAIIADGVPPMTASARMHDFMTNLGLRVSGLAQIGLCYLFPAPYVVALAGDEKLAVPPSRANVVREFAREVAADRIRLDRSVGLDELVASIVKIDGISARAAQEIAFRVGEPDAWPYGARQWGEPGSRWHPWRAIAAAHLWEASPLDAHAAAS